MSRNTIIMGAAILTTANIITRILGFAYRIYMSNLIGAEGMGLYQLIMPIYMLCWSITASGFTTTVSKLTAEEYAVKAYGNMRRLLKQAVFISGSAGLLLGIVLFFFAEFAAVYIIKDIRVMLQLKILSFCFPFMAAGSCIRGFFNGMRENLVPAVSQVFEQAVRMVAVYLLAGAFIPRGIEYACSAAVIGIVLGEVLSFLYVYVCYKWIKQKNGLVKKPSWTMSKTLTLLLAGALPLTANRITSSLLMAIENILIPQKLSLFENGAGNALKQYGLISGMAIPLIAFPSAVLMAVSITLVPAVSEAVAYKNKERIGYAVAKSILFTTVVGIGASSLFFIFPNEIGMAVFKQKELGPLLTSLSFICPFYYMQITLSGILNGLSEQMFILKANILSSIISICGIVFFIPKYGINAFIAAWLISIIITCTICSAKICDRTNLSFDIKNWIYKPIIAALAAGLLARSASEKFLFTNFSYVNATIFSICILAALYTFFIYSLDAVSKEDIKAVTKSIKL